MFWRKKKTIEWPLLFFGMIALGIIISIVLLLMILFSRLDSKTRSIVDLKEQMQSLSSPKQVVDDYEIGLEEMMLVLEKTQDVKEVFVIIEKEMFQLHVPKERLKDHLQAFLAVDGLKENISEPGVREQAINLINDLLSKAQTQKYETAAN